MRHKFETIKYLVFLFLASFLISSCSSNPTNQPAQTPDSIEIATPSKQPTVSQSASQTPDPIPLPTITPTPTETPRPYSWTEILDPKTDEEIEAAIWEPDGDSFYFARSVFGENDEYQWFQYSLLTGKISATEETLPRFRPNASSWEFRGDRRSPSLRYEFSTDILNPNVTPYPEGLDTYFYRHWLVDTITGVRYIVVEKTIRPIVTTHWSHDETRFIFWLGGEGIGEARIANVGELAEQAYGASSISPDGNWYTSTDYIFTDSLDLNLVNYETRESILIAQRVHQIRWSQDSNTLSFWDENQSGDLTLTSYDVQTQEKARIVALAQLHRNGICRGYCSFQISPDKEMAVFWEYGQLWLVAFSDNQTQN